MRGALKRKDQQLKILFNFFKYSSSETVKLNENTKTIFTLLSMIQNVSFLEIDTLNGSALSMKLKLDEQGFYGLTLPTFGME